MINYTALNSIGDKGAKALGEVLKLNNTLTLLDISSIIQLNWRYCEQIDWWLIYIGNKIGNEGAKALGEVLKHNNSLSQLNLESMELLIW